MLVFFFCVQVVCGDWPEEQLDAVKEDLILLLNNNLCSLCYVTENPRQDVTALNQLWILFLAISHFD